MSRSYQIVYDPVYGQISVPSFLSPLLNSPELKRLSSIRLLNYESIQLAALSEVRRLSHTLGVMHLGTRIRTIDFDSTEINALLCAILLHDIGTPPFGHTVEYEFVRRYRINHEQIASNILDASHHPLAEDHQIYEGQAPQLSKVISSLGIEETVRSILAGNHPLSKYLFGDIDLDNIDNVFRMAHYLGFSVDHSTPVEIASELIVDKNGDKFFPVAKKSLIESWMSAREQSYRTILGVRMHRQNQAVFARIVFEAIQLGLISKFDWFLTDERLNARLQRESELSRYFVHLHRGVELYEVSLAFRSEVRMPRTVLLDHRDRITQGLEHELNTLVYVSVESVGDVLTRRLRFFDTATSEPWSMGEPQPTYRLNVYVASPKVRGRLADAVGRQFGHCAERSGWIIEPNSAGATPARGGVVEF
ncbi:HD domain-containing protein [Mesorhizobium sp. CA14]|uniref:HD domain-containing protein n=1 Tax=Mesorhizobium sp. CA14 TaxID=2876642 RepID=UPI001CCFD78C|nr:HD domain-containing protein [Mesorhizobium sp. CA14]MBZ9850287.1 HD domain-containing protein [Mesorhizobium sp. CA14]